MRSFQAALVATVFLMVEVSSISVPTGKETPITPAKSTPRPHYPVRAGGPAPVTEYTEDNPEPPPVDPSYVPVVYKYIKALSADKVYYVPFVIRNVPVYGQGDDAPVVAYRTVQTVPQYKKYDYKYRKPTYYAPKGYTGQRQPTKGGYPKKAIQTNKYYYYENQQ